MLKLRRDANYVKSFLVEDKSGRVLTRKSCTIQLPERFMTRNLGQIGISTFAYGCFALIMDSGEYSVFNVNALIELTPSKITKSTINEIEYYNFHFDENDVVIKTTHIVKRDNIIYDVMDELVFKGKIPWYMEYNDLGKMFSTAKKYANSGVGKNQEVIELIASIITRVKSNKSKYIRLGIKDYKDTSLENTAYVPLSSVFYSASTTLNKIAGNYFNDGVVSALVEPSNNVEQIESILRA